VVTAAVASSAPPALSTADAPLPPVSLHFDWTPPLRASVTQFSDIRGKTARVRYDLVVSRAPGSEHLAVGHEGVRYLEIDGQTTGPESELRLAAAALAEVNVFPTMTVSREGELVDLPSLDKVIEATITSLGRQPTARAGDEALARKFLAAPEMQASITSKVGERWTLWVGAWQSLPSPLSAPQELSVEIPLPDGSKIQAPMRFTAPTPLPGPGGLVRLSATSVLEGERARQAVLHAMRHIMQETDPSTDPATYIATVRREMRMEVETEAKTLRPHRAKMTMTISLADRNGKGSIRREVNEYTFDWHSSP
jgi:hypothetical protein